ncbi:MULTISPECIES: restriction endonuclease [Flavobacterium]|uniref:restriction endonuclease n=1 Tax=Flavobacterium TaxID=237 RepID=UPI0023E3E450|nr:restriction endonuclease [Flavobacterium sp. YJ01]WET02538.1 restriction endonuclease [Flavobacterium sp. YJ01]
MFENDNLDWKKYEVVTKYIYETLGKESGVKIKGYGNGCKVKGKSGVSHQIDVLTSYSDGIHAYQTAIECKYWQEKINKDIVMKVAEIIEDAGINKGVIVSKKGFTEDGINYAKYKNIGLVELREAEEKIYFQDKSKANSVDVSDFKSTLLRPEILYATIDLVDKVEKEREQIKISQSLIVLSDGTQIPFEHYANMFKKELHIQKKIFQTITKSYELPGASLLNKRDNISVKIRSVVFTGVLIQRNADLKFSLVDQVWLIMKSIFEERSFIISKNGVISENK